MLNDFACAAKEGSCLDGQTTHATMRPSSQIFLCDPLPSKDGVCLYIDFWVNGEFTSCFLGGSFRGKPDMLHLLPVTGTSLSL